MKWKPGLVIILSGWAMLLPQSVWAADSGRAREVAQGRDAKDAKSSPSKKDDSKKEESKSEDVKKEDAKKDDSSDNKNRPKAKGKGPPVITPEREAAARTFVDQHHPELAALLVHLKENNRKEYERAVRDLFRTSERLARVHEMDVERYDLELKLWQAQSRIDLLAARYTMNPVPGLRKQLKEVIVERQSLQKSLLALDRTRLTEKLAKLDDQLKTLEKSGSKSVDEQLQALTGGTGPSEKEKSEKEKTDKGDKSAGLRIK